MALTSSLEREIKLSAPARFRLPLLDDAEAGLSAEPEEVTRHAAVYFDTEDLRLTGWDCGLRHRSSDGWTLKLADTGRGDAVERREFHLAGPAGEVPAPIRDLVLGVTRGRPLVPIVRLATLRRVVRVRDALGRCVAEVSNDHVTVSQGERSGRRFREVEVELASCATPQAVEAILARLRRAGTGSAHRVAKHLRALGLESILVREVAIPDVGPDASAADLVRHVVAQSVDALVRHDAGARLGDDPEDLHQLRVAARRLRSHLRSFRPVLEATWARRLRAELRSLGEALGRVRDLDVLGACLRRAVVGLDASDRAAGKQLIERLARERETALDGLRLTLRSPDYLALVDRLVAAARAPRVLPAAQRPGCGVAVEAVRARWRHLARSVKRLPRCPEAAALHAVRIRAKHVRYAAEAAEPLAGRPAGRLARRARRLQQTLGDHRDAALTSAWLRTAASEVPGRTAFVAGRLALEQQQRGARALAHWRKASRAVSRPRAWLRAAPATGSGPRQAEGKA